MDAMTYTADIDVGGTFTDGFFTDGSVAHRAKVLTTPHDLTECFVNCLRDGAAAFELPLPGFLGRTQVVRLSTTLGTNTLLQRHGPKVGLLVTSGAEHALYGDGDAAALRVFLEQDLVRGIDEYIDDHGEAVTAPAQAQVLQAVRELVELGTRIIAVSLRNGWRNPIHEKRVRELVRERYPVHYLRSVPLQLAHEVTSTDDDHIRTNTVALNAYLHSDLSRGLYRAEDLARDYGMRRPLLVVHAAGGSARVAKTVAVQTLSSGPAVATRGAAIAARRLELDNVVTADMGGTSLDVAVLDTTTEPPVIDRPIVSGIRIAIPVVSTESIGAGGGSIAKTVDGRVVVGPDSAGSIPGPACYAKGGLHPTVTDANLLLGLLDPNGFLGGRMRLDVDRSRKAMDRRFGRALDVEPEMAAAMVRAEVNSSMSARIRALIEAAELDPSTFTMFAFGGGGPLHGCDIAEQVGIRRVVGFPYGAVFSAFGSSTVDVWHRYTASLVGRLDSATTRLSAKETIADLRAQGVLDMRGEGFDRHASRESSHLLVDAGGQRHRVPVEDTDEVEAVCDDVARRWSDAQLREVVLDIRAPMPTWQPPRHSLTQTSARPYAHREVRWRWEVEPASTALLRLDGLDPGATVDGPAIVEADDTVYAVNPGWSASIDAYGNVVMEHVTDSGRS